MSGKLEAIQLQLAVQDAAYSSSTARELLSSRIKATVLHTIAAVGRISRHCIISCKKP